MQVTDGDKLSVWLEKEFLPNIFGQPWYNGLKDKEDVYIENKASLLIGMPWMRQLRIQKGNYFFSFFPLFHRLYLNIIVNNLFSLRIQLGVTFVCGIQLAQTLEAVILGSIPGLINSRGPTISELNLLPLFYICTL